MEAEELKYDIDFDIEEYDGTEDGIVFQDVDPESGHYVHGQEDDNGKLLIDDHELPFYMNLIQQINTSIKRKYRARDLVKAKRKERVIEVVSELCKEQQDCEHVDFVAPVLDHFYKPESGDVEEAEPMVLAELEEEPDIIDDVDILQTELCEVELKPSPSKVSCFKAGEYPDAGAKLPECVPCDVIFKTLADYKQHMKDHHAPELPFQCDVCSKQFRTKTILKQHQRFHGPKDHECDICGEGFPFPVFLRRHLLTHTKEKPFSCSFCPKRFSQQPHLNRHLTSHSKEAADHECITCNKKYKRKESLVKHCRTHNHIC